MTKLFNTLLLILIIAGTGYYFRDEWKNFIFPFIPCAKPITYSIGSFDTRFGITKTAFIETIKESEMVWEDALDKQLFQYSATGTMKINLLYDYRQEATDSLRGVDVTIKQDRASYEKVRAQYDSLRAEYDLKKRQYDNQVRAYENGDRTSKQDVDELNADGKELNKLAAEINAAANLLNDIIKKLNMKVNVFNTIGASTGEEFSEGEYIRDKEGERINVYQFDTEAKLRRLLQHELGHALGLNHVDNQKAIMYRVNLSTNEKLTPDDLAELKAMCKSL